jgi:hypothetical protein
MLDSALPGPYLLGFTNSHVPTCIYPHPYPSPSPSRWLAWSDHWMVVSGPSGGCYPIVPLSTIGSFIPHTTGLASLLSLCPTQYPGPSITYTGDHTLPLDPIEDVTQVMCRHRSGASSVGGPPPMVGRRDRFSVCHEVLLELGAG